MLHTKRIAGLIAALIVAGCQAAEAPKPPQASESTRAPVPSVPSEAQGPAPGDALASISKPGDVVLARKEFDLMRLGAPQTVAIIKRTGPDASRTHPCEIFVMQKVASGFRTVASNDKVVDCLYNDIAKNAKDLSENLTLGAERISYNNQGEAGRTEYTFRYSKETNDWFLSEAVSYYSGPSPDNTDQYDYKESAKYPGNIPKIALSQFDPEKILDVMRKGREVQ